MMKQFVSRVVVNGTLAAVGQVAHAGTAFIAMTRLNVHRVVVRL